MWLATGFTGTAEYVGHSSEGLKDRGRRYQTSRKDTIERLLRLALQKGAVLIRAPPYSGKTSLLQLAASEAERGSQTSTLQGGYKKDFYVSLAAMCDREGEGSGLSFDAVWNNAYPDTAFQSVATVSTSRDPRDLRPNLVLVDEAQCAFDKGDTPLWALLKNLQGALEPNVRMIMVSSFGSDVARQIGGIDTVRTPGNWQDGTAVVSLRYAGVLRSFQQVHYHCYSLRSNLLALLMQANPNQLPGCAADKLRG